MASELNRRLTQQDASFLYLERPNQPMHGVGVAVYDGHLSLDDVIRVTEERLHLMPRYRQKLVFPPYLLTHPTWEDAPAFDTRNHITEETLPPPGDDRALAAAAARYLVPPLDRSRPLWKMVVVQGHADGNTAVFSMVHHAMIDGVSGVDLMLVTHDLTPEAEPPPPPPAPWQPTPIPDQLTLLQDAVRDQLIEQAERWTDETFGRYRPQEAAERAQRINNAVAASMPGILQPAPRMPFNGAVTTQRAVSWASFSFAEVRGIRSVLGGTVNDVVLAVIAGALGEYLRRHTIPTQGLELRAMCPVSMRAAEGHGALGNQVSMMIAPLFVGIADPVERLRAERTAMERLKAQDQAGGFYAMTSQPNTAPAWVQAWAGQFETPQTMLNTVTTNVPGPQIPLYLAGHKLLASFGFGMLSANIGLFNAIGSYNQMLTIGATVDPTMVPDVWFYAECLERSFAELRDAAQRVAEAAEASAGNGAKADGQRSREKTGATASR